MHEYRHRYRGLKGLPFLIFLIATTLGSCTVYTINKGDLESRLKPKQHAHAGKKGLNALAAMHARHYNNAMDTLQCSDAVGKLRTKHFSYDSKITIVTMQNRSIRMYAKTLYIWNGQYLVGERTSLNLYGSNYCLVKLSDISRIEVRKPWF